MFRPTEFDESWCLSASYSEAWNILMYVQWIKLSKKIRTHPYDTVETTPMSGIDKQLLKKSAVKYNKKNKLENVPFFSFW